MESNPILLVFKQIAQSDPKFKAYFNQQIMNFKRVMGMDQAPPPPPPKKEKPPKTERVKKEKVPKRKKKGLATRAIRAPKQIKCPVWGYFNGSGSTHTYEGCEFDYCTVHSHLEYFEKKLKNREIPNCYHAAMATNFQDTPIDGDLPGWPHHEVSPYPVPSFWERRPWDESETILSVDESNDLTNRINSIGEADFEVKKAKSSKAPTIILSTKPVLTDNSDNESDF